MSVAIVGASGVIGRATVEAFARVDADVRAVVDRPEPADGLRAAGAKVAVGEPDDDDDDAVPATVFGADSVCFLAGEPDLNAGVERIGQVERVIAVARRAGVRRFLFVSALGADASSPNACLRAAGAAEEEIRTSDLEFAIVRTAAVYGIGGGAWLELVVAGATQVPPVVLGDPERVVVPVFAGDAAEVLVAADSRAEPVRGTWSLEGPERVTAGDLVAALAGDDAVPRVIAADVADAERLLGRSIPTGILDLLTGSWPADAPDAASEFGVELTPLAEGLRRIASAARLER